MMKRIILAITGGIAAYKSAVLARLLVKAGFEVRVIMSQGAQAFITPLTLQALTGNAVHTELLDAAAERGMGHIELAKWADIMLIAPASANTLARLAMGMADDLLTTVCLATAAPVLVAPAMNQQMWQHPSVQLNLQTLADLGYRLVMPDSGEQACGDVGMGRLPEPETLLAHVEHTLARLTVPQVLAGRHIVITAGPTIEAIDPVRYLSNHSTGKMGFALAKACCDAGARVTLIAGGKVQLPTPLGVTRINVLSAEQMLVAAQLYVKGDENWQSVVDDDPHDHHHHAAHHHDAPLPDLPPADVFIATAAVADYRTRQAAPQKIKKTQDELTLDLVKNPDILATISAEFPNVFTVGFAAETQDVERYARGKLTAKNLDMIACNDVSRSDIGFGSDDNAMTVFFRDQHDAITLPKASKGEIAAQLVGLIGRHIRACPQFNLA